MSKYDQKKLLAMTWNVWISGTKLSLEKKQCINSIEIVETVEGSDSASIGLSDPEFLYIEDDIFIEDNKIKIELGWDSSTYKVSFNGYISAIDITFGADGVPFLTITCMDNTHKMNRKKKDKTFNKMTSAEVVRKIVQEYGFTCVTDPDYKFTKQETITQSQQTDIDFIIKLARDEIYPFTARLVGDTFYYVKMGKMTTPKMTLTYMDYPHEIISFSPQINKETRQEQTSGGSVDTKSKSSSSSKSSGKKKSGSSSSGKKTGTKGKSGNKPKIKKPVVQNPPKKTHTYDPTTKKWSSSGGGGSGKRLALTR